MDSSISSQVFVPTSKSAFATTEPLKETYFKEIDKNNHCSVTASSGTAISTDFATLTCSEIWSKILIRCVTWH